MAIRLGTKGKGNGRERTLTGFTPGLLSPFFTEAPNAAHGAKARGIGNPWTYILAMEGGWSCGRRV